MTDLADKLARDIASDGPMPLVRFMAEANAHYYATRDPLGAAGDFITAPEVSQMFGELIGLWLADLWTRAGSPGDIHYVELGPGRGTLAEDALRAMRAVRLEPPIHLVETSRVLRDSQASRLPTARWHDDIDSLPDSGPLLIVANEFFDALPIRQLVRGEDDWRELMVDHSEGVFTPVAGGPPLDRIVPERLRDAPPGSMLETSPGVQTAARALAERIARQGGAALIVDYGYEGPATGDTLQAVSGHAAADVFETPGDSDLTAHVDFALLERAGKDAGTRIFGPIAQGDFLRAIGIEARTSILARSAPDRREELIAARDRLIDTKQMGTLFRVMALVSRDWPEPAGF